MPSKSQPSETQAGAATKKPNPIAKKRVNALIAVCAIIVVVVAILFVQVGGLLNPSTPSQAASEDAGAAMATMDLNAMYEAEINSYLAVIDQHPDNRETLLHIAETYHNWAQSIVSGSNQSSRAVEDLFSASIDYYVSALKLDDNDIESIGHLGYVYFNWAEYMLGMTDADLEVYYLLYVNSIDCFTQAIEGNDGGIIGEEEIADMTVNKAVALYTLNKVDEAIAELEGMVASQSGHFQAHYNLGLFYEAKGDTETSRAYYEQARGIAEHAGDAEHVAAAEAKIQSLQAS